MASLLLLKSMIFSKALHKRQKKKKVKNRLINQKHGTNNCRICNEEKAYIQIFNNYMELNIAAEINFFSGVEIVEEDKFSKYICQTCLDLLNGCILFRDLCQKTNKLMNEVINNDLIKTEKSSCEKTISQEMDKECNLNEYNLHENNLDVSHNNVKTDYHCENSLENIKDGNASDDSFNIPSPSFSDRSNIWSCTTCLQDFYDLSSYNKHLSKCNVKPKSQQKQIEEPTKKKFLCETCGKTATSRASLLIHMSTHDNIFPYKCDVCPYQGRTIDLLKVHKRSHLTDKPFKCTQCNKATTTSSNLAKHMRHVHSTNRPYKCTYCDKFFSYQHDMKRHVRDIHLRQGTVECDICSKKFNTKKILQGHRWKIHKIKSERSGRLPSYLLCQMEKETNLSNCDNNYQQ